MKKSFLIFNFIGTKSSMLLCLVLLLSCLFLFAIFNVYYLNLLAYFSILIICVFVVGFFRYLPNWKTTYPILFLIFGIKCILVGGVITFYYGFHQTLFLENGKSSSEIIMQNEYDLVINHNEQELFSIPYTSLSSGQQIFEDDISSFTIKKSIPNSILGLRAEKSSLKDVGIKFRYYDSKSNTKRIYWLVNNSPFKEVQNELLLPRAFVALSPYQTGTYLKLFLTDTEQVSFINPKEVESQLKIENRYVISNFSYYPRAEVIDNKLVNSSKVYNPAVEFTISDQNGHQEQHTRFAFLPYLPTKNQLKPDDKNFPIWISLIPNTRYIPKHIDNLIFSYDSNDWFFKINKEEKHLVTEGQKIAIGKDYIEVLALLKGIRMRRVALPVRGNFKNRQDSVKPALLIQEKKSKKQVWISLTRPYIHSSGTSFLMTRKKREMPFKLSLMSAQSQEIELVSEEQTITKKVAVNNPIKFKDYYILLSNCSDSACSFVVNYNPSRNLIYVGAFLLLLGIALLRVKVATNQ